MHARRAVLVLGLAAVLAGPASAVPSAQNSTIPQHLLMVGRLFGQADTALGAFTIVVRDLANNPIANCPVEVRLLNCEGARIASDALQSGAATACATHAVTATTDFQGVVRVAVVGGGTPGSAPGAGACSQIFARGVLLGMASVGYLDMDGVNGIGINDLALWLADLALAEPISRSDFDGNGEVTINDLSFWLEAWSRGKSPQSATGYCP